MEQVAGAGYLNCNEYCFLLFKLNAQQGSPRKGLVQA